MKEAVTKSQLLNTVKLLWHQFDGSVAIFTPSVDTAGNLSWSNDRGLSNPATVNIMGPPGPTPVKGEDYFTEADKQELVEAVLAALPSAEEVAF